MILFDTKINDVSVIGGKGLGLNKLVSYGYNVPNFFVIAAGTDLNGDGFAAELDVSASKLHCKKFAVRSSNVSEDGEHNSFAGQFATELNVTRGELYQAVCRVAASCANKNTTSYAKHFGVGVSSMAIVVQAQVDAEYSGVMFTTSPFTPDHLLIERVAGAGERLVSGTVIPEKLELQKGSPAQSKLIDELCNAAYRLEQLEGNPLDIEWALQDGKLYFLQLRPLTALGDDLPTVPSSDWSLYVYRDFCLFCQSIQIKASESDVQRKLFGFDTPIFEGLLINGREFYTSRNDELSYEKWRTLDKDNFFEEYVCKLNASVQNTKRRTARLANADLSSVDDGTLFRLYKSNITAYLNSYVPLMMRPDDYLYGELAQLLGEQQCKEAISKVAALSRNTLYASEQAAFLQAIATGKTEEYIAKYQWFYNPLGKKLQPLDEQNFTKRARRFTKEQALNRLAQIKRQRAQDRRIAKEFLRSVTDKRVSRLLNLAVEFIGLRTYTAENSDRFFYFIRTKILSEISKRFGVAQDRLLLMTFEEVAALQRGATVPFSQLAKRSRGSMTVFADGKHETYYGGQTYAILAKLLPRTELNGEVVCGEIACQGEVTARVKIINNFDETAKMQDGEIIVTSMTTPELTLALEKAVGIITDEGGITCHAAIIAREYGIPCLVGTVNATAVLHDGDLVQLDCIHGWFKVLKN